MKYLWFKRKSLQENAEINGIHVRAMQSYKRRHSLKCASFKKRRLKKLVTFELVDFLYTKGFNYNDMSRIFKTTITDLYRIRRKGLLKYDSFNIANPVRV